VNEAFIPAIFDRAHLLQKRVETIISELNALLDIKIKEAETLEKELLIDDQGSKEIPTDNPLPPGNEPIKTNLYVSPEELEAISMDIRYFFLNNPDHTVKENLWLLFRGYTYYTSQSGGSGELAGMLLFYEQLLDVIELFAKLSLFKFLPEVSNNDRSNTVK